VKKCEAFRQSSPNGLPGDQPHTTVMCQAMASKKQKQPPVWCLCVTCKRDFRLLNDKYGEGFTEEALRQRVCLVSINTALKHTKEKGKCADTHRNYFHNLYEGRYPENGAEVERCYGEHLVALLMLGCN
jgi:hypothetical protein